MSKFIEVKRKYDNVYELINIDYIEEIYIALDKDNEPSVYIKMYNLENPFCICERYDDIKPRLECR